MTPEEAESAIAAFVADKEGKCPGCWGQGERADDAEDSPWLTWLALPEESRLAVTLGLVGPVACPDCGGSGRA